MRFRARRSKSNHPQISSLAPLVRVLPGPNWSVSATLFRGCCGLPKVTILEAPARSGSASNRYGQAGQGFSMKKLFFVSCVLLLAAVTGFAQQAPAPQPKPAPQGTEQAAS